MSKEDKLELLGMMELLLGREANMPKMHLFAQYPPCPDGTQIPILDGNLPKNKSTIAALLEALQKDYGILLVAETVDGRSGYRDQQNRFFLYVEVNTPFDLQNFYESIGATDEFWDAIKKDPH